MKWVIVGGRVKWKLFIIGSGVEKKSAFPGGGREHFWNSPQFICKLQMVLQLLAYEMNFLSKSILK